jgi:D-alanyl-D-alanine carboxypeptidase/D-alanyl-D-alanine-endopeptidase (penicillin-binding protein 4)
VKTVKSRGRARLRASSSPSGNDRQRISVAGMLPVNRDTAIFYKKVDNPPMYAGETFKALFKERGIAVKGKVRLGAVPVDAVKLYVHKSPALAEIVRELNKVSNNFVAEMLLKTVGAEVKGTPGTWPKGIAATEEYLSELGILKGSYVMKNGSGLNDTNRFSAAQITTLLQTVAQKSTFYPEYASSLGIAGRDGTIRSRMEGSVAEGRLRGKTGTLENVKSLSGYVTTPSGETLIYAVMVNGLSRRLHGAAMASIDEVGIALASGGGTETMPDSALAAIGPPDVKARVATFASLAKAPNPDNLPFLRSAWRVEQDPILRAVIAEVIYRTDPENGVASLIDSVPADGALFAKLRTIGQELQIPTPMVSSLIDVAAEGNPDALDKLIGLAHQTRDDAETNTLLADGLQEIGRTAPDELVEAIQRAPADVSVEAIALLGQGIASSDDKAGHPFLETLKSMGDAKANGPKAPLAIGLSDKLHRILTDPRPASTTSEPKLTKPDNTAVPGGG